MKVEVQRKEPAKTGMLMKHIPMGTYFDGSIGGIYGPFLKVGCSAIAVAFIVKLEQPGAIWWNQDSWVNDYCPITPQTILIKE